MDTVVDWMAKSSQRYLVWEYCKYLKVRSGLALRILALLSHLCQPDKATPETILITLHILQAYLKTRKYITERLSQVEDRFQNEFHRKENVKLMPCPHVFSPQLNY